MRYFIRNGVRLIAEGLGLKKIAEFGGFTFFLDNMSLFEGLSILGSQLIAKIV